MRTTGMGTLALSVMLTVGAGAAAPRDARAEEGAEVRAEVRATVGGRIVFRDATRELSAQEVERLRWGHIAVELRRGWQVFAGRPDATGLFTIVGPPGTYHFEYLRLGELAEFFPPHEVEAAPGRITCIGTLEVTVADLVRDLGQNTASTLRVRDDCAEFGSSLRQLAASGSTVPVTVPATGTGGGGAVTAVVARATPARGFTPSVMQVLVGLRIEGDFTSAQVAATRGNLVVPVSADNGKGNMIASLSVARVGAEFINAQGSMFSTDPPLSGTGWGGSLGVGYSVWGIEISGFGGYLKGLSRGPSGPLLGGSARLGGVVFGVGVRHEQYLTTPHQVTTLTLDLSPIGLLGALL